MGSFWRKEKGESMDGVRSAERLGRDGSPSRPFADRVPYLDRLNGGLGEPALPKAPIQSSGLRSPFEFFAFGRAAIAMAAVRGQMCESPGTLFDPSHVGPPTDVMAITSLPKAERLFGSQVSALRFLVQVFRCRYRSQAPNPNLNLLTRTRLPIAETRDLKMCAPANHPVPGLPLSPLPLVGTALRAVRSRTEFRTSIGLTAGSESHALPKAASSVR
jgi:hypothetical protein